MCCWWAAERKVVSLYGRFLAETRQRFGRNGNMYKIALRMRLKIAPAWMARNPDTLNFFGAAYNELLAL
jgi:hypothetical protein